ncbi:MAG TPA: tetratricopeptide repeat protein [Terriglobales bacterium]|nr:tetratricopeptide repeat protein [Terriglobales bacterium]
MKRAVVLILAVHTLFPPCLYAQQKAAAGRTIVVIPFENTSPTPGLEWLSEAFPEAFHEQLHSPVLYVASRDERLRAYDRQGIPANLHPSRATLYRLAEQMDVDYAVLGSYRYDGTRLTATAQLLDMRAQRLLPASTESGPLTDLGNLQSALAWDLLHLVRADLSLPKEKYIGSVSPMRLDALENYIRGMLSTTMEERVQHYKEAVRVNPAYSEAWLELGKAYLAQRTYDLAISALSQVPPSSAYARAASFYLGLAAFYHGDFARAENAFEFVAARLPLAEVYNNLGVVAARRGRRNSAEYFEKAIRNDPSDPDYHFNLGISLSLAGDRSGAAREVRKTLDQSPNNVEAKALLDSVTSPVAGVLPSASVSKTSALRIKRNYDEDTFRQMTVQIQSWAEQQFARSDPRSHARYHVELGRELLAHGFTAEAESEFNHAATVDSASTAPLTALAEVSIARGDAREARTRAEDSLRLRESAEAYLVLAGIDLSENRADAAAQNVNRAVRLEPGNLAAQSLKRAIAAKLVEKAP